MTKIDELVYEMQAVGAESNIKVPHKDRILEIVAMCVVNEDLHKLFQELVNLGIRRGIDVEV